MNRERLLILADHLDTLPAEGYNIHKWSTCAIGQAVKAGLFPGLEMSNKPLYSGNSPTYEGLSGFPAVGRLFELSDYNASDLFYFAPSTETPQQTAQRIREFVK